MTKPLQISPEAIEAARYFVWPSGTTHTLESASDIIQLAINFATEKLTKDLADSNTQRDSWQKASECEHKDKLALIRRIKRLGKEFTEYKS